MGETKIIYHIDDEDTPYLIKLPIPADRVTLGDFKNALNRPNFKFFFKSMDDDFGVVKEEIVDEDAHLPCFNGRVVSWLVGADNSASDNQSVTDSQTGDVVQLPAERGAGIGDSRPPSFHANASVVSRDDQCDTCTESESVMSGARRGPRVNGHQKHERHRLPRALYETSTMLSSDLDTTSFIDSEEDTASRFSTVTDTTGMSSKYGRQRRRRRRHRPPPISRVGINKASSFSSITDSTMSLNIITVTLNMDTVNFLGISIVGQSNKGGDGGIYVGSIMKGGAVAQDGRVEPGDMILEVNGVSFENMSNDDAVKTLREAVQKPGPIVLVVAKCWDPNPKGYFTVPRQEPVRPIDPSAWVAHTTAMREQYMGRGGPSAPSVSNMTSTTSSSLTSSIPESERGFNDDMNLTISTEMGAVVKAMSQADSGLEIRDRMWLKITIANAFIGADLVDWLFTHVEGFSDRRDARKYACHLLKAGYIRHTVNKLTFSEQCYYIFGDYYGGPPMYPDLSSLNLDDVDSVSEADRDTLAPLPPPSWALGSNHHLQHHQQPHMHHMQPHSLTASTVSRDSPHHFAPPYNSTYLPQNLHYIPAYMLNNSGGGADNASFVGSFVDMAPSGMVSLPPGGVSGTGGGAGSAGSVHSASVVGKDCACLSSTYSQLKRLWENKDKQLHMQQQQKSSQQNAQVSTDLALHSARDAGSDDNDSYGFRSHEVDSFRQKKNTGVGGDHAVDNGDNPSQRLHPGLNLSSSTSSCSNNLSLPTANTNNNSNKHCLYYEHQKHQHSTNRHRNNGMGNSTRSLGSSASGNSHKKIGNNDKSNKSGGSGSDTDASLVSARRMRGVPGGMPPMGLPPGAPPMTSTSNLINVPPEVSGSRQSFRLAMGNPSLIEAEDID